MAEPQRMAIDGIDDCMRRIERQDAFWDRAILDRPVVCIRVPKPVPVCPVPPWKKRANVRDGWMDAEEFVTHARAHVLNTDYFGDALPTVCPNLGPDVFSAFFGTELEYSEVTSWAVHNLHDWAEVDQLQFRESNAYWKKLVEITDACLEAGRNLFYTGLSDLHPGADVLVAFRSPMNLNLDLLDCPEQVKSLLARVTDTYCRVLDFYFEKLGAAGQAYTCWAGIVSTRRWYVPSNDFSCMVSKEMFDEIFLPGLRRECRHTEANLYHLDGPGALRHLDSLLDLPELNAVQWIYGAGNGRSSDWLDTFQRIQNAGKGVQLQIDADELDLFIENLRPEGVWMSIDGVQNAEHAHALIRKVEKWC